MSSEPTRTNPQRSSVGLGLVVAKRWAIVASLMVLAGADVQAQVPAERGIFLETVDVTLVNIEVVVTADGKPVTDLEAEDFVVLDDSQVVEISLFQPMVGGRPRTLASVPDADLPANVPKPEAVPVPRRVVIVVDDSFLAPASRVRLLKRLDESLDQWMTGDTRVLVAHKDRNVSVVIPFTGESAEVVAGLAEISSRAPSAFPLPGVRADVATLLLAANDGGGLRLASTALPQGSAEATELAFWVEMVGQDLLSSPRGAENGTGPRDPAGVSGPISIEVYVYALTEKRGVVGHGGFGFDIDLGPKPAHLEGDLHKSLGLNHFRKCSTNLRVRLRFS